jgi:hypothetical protein
VLPITAIVAVMKFFPGAMTWPQFIRFLVGAVLVIGGLSIFLLGVDIGITPLGELMGNNVSKTNKLWYILVIGLALGFFISIAEPDLQVLASQVSAVTEGRISMPTLLVVVAIGIAVLLTLGFVRIVYNIPLYLVLTGAYTVIFILALMVPSEFLAIAFDSSGATTGALTVPFILALTLGVSSLKKDSKASEKDSFGLVAIASSGAVMSVLLMGVFKNVSDISGELPEEALETGIIAPFLHEFPHALLDSFVSILPICAIFLLFQFISFHLKRRPFQRLLMGLIYTLVGLSIFITGVSSGFMLVGKTLGQWIGSTNQAVAVGLGLLLGVVTVLAEPAVHVLTNQIETVTAGYVKRQAVMTALALGVGVAVAFSILRIITPGLQLWHFLLPGYVIAIGLSFVAPKLFVGIAFDAGGVASGPMTATFILAFTQGVATASPTADVLRDAFGMIALVAMTPIVMLELLGLIFKLQTGARPGGVVKDGESDGGL